MFNGLILIGMCILLGIAVKVMDQLIDELNVHSNKLWIGALAIFIPCALAYLAITEGPVIGMVIGTVIGLLLTKKIDHPAYLVSIILFLTFIFSAFELQVLQIQITTFYIIPVAAAGSFLDEFGHEHWNSKSKSITFIFKHRFFLKIFAFFGVLLGFAQIIHFLGFLCFDIFYDIVPIIGRYPTPSNYVHPPLHAREE